MDEDSILAGRDDGEEVGVQCMLKGLWKVEGRYWVVEGECPVSLFPWSGDDTKLLGLFSGVQDGPSWRLWTIRKRYRRGYTAR
jgi:hypothetical protein